MSWQRPERISRLGTYVALAPLDPEADSDDLYTVSHEPAAYQHLWTYLFNGPFADRAAMRQWLHESANRDDVLYFTVNSLELQRNVGMIGIMNIESAMGRAELGGIWYSPLVQRTKVNTETTYLLLRYLFEDLGYRRAEWKCNNENERSKQTAQRMGFVPEGLFRQHMVIKGRNRDTAWFSMLDREWPTRKANFERHLYGAEAVSLTALNAETQR